MLKRSSDKDPQNKSRGGAQRSRKSAENTGRSGGAEHLHTAKKMTWNHANVLLQDW